MSLRISVREHARWQWGARYIHLQMSECSVQSLIFSCHFKLGFLRNISSGTQPHNKCTNVFLKEAVAHWSSSRTNDDDDDDDVELWEHSVAPVEWKIVAANLVSLSISIQPSGCRPYRMKLCHRPDRQRVNQTDGRSWSQWICRVKTPGHCSPVILLALLTDVELCQLPNMYSFYSFPPPSARLDFCPYLVRKRNVDFSQFVPKQRRQREP